MGGASNNQAIGNNQSMFNNQDYSQYQLQEDQREVNQ